MKKIFALFTFAILAGCAKNNPEFVPLSLNWFEFQGNLTAIDSSFKQAKLDSSKEETCLISMTRALMEETAIRDSSKNGKEYNIQYTGILENKKTQMEFRGMCASANDTLNLERDVLQFSTIKNCNFTARCDENGKIQNLKIF